MAGSIGSMDKVLRVLIGLILISLMFYGPATPFGWIGMGLILSAFVNYCPLYGLLGIKT